MKHWIVLLGILFLGLSCSSTTRNMNITDLEILLRENGGIVYLDRWQYKGKRGEENGINEANVLIESGRLTLLEAISYYTPREMMKYLREEMPIEIKLVVWDSNEMSEGNADYMRGFARQMYKRLHEKYGVKKVSKWRDVARKRANAPSVDFVNVIPGIGWAP